jgi:hypothetical protein
MRKANTASVSDFTSGERIADIHRTSSGRFGAVAVRLTLKDFVLIGPNPSFLKEYVLTL